MNKFVIYFIFYFYIKFGNADDDFLVVTTKQGKLNGTEVTNLINNEIYYAFYDIPYAQAPTGPNRFKEPREPLPWDGIRDAQEEGNACITMNPIFQSVSGDEDCLNLNIYTNKIPGEVKGSPRPVMVWIHGGAFHMGSNSPDSYGPEFLMMEDIVLVCINYRLAVFGFLSLQNEEVPGNAGLKDQVMALKWIKENILSFGGDPEKITIFGESAGGASVHYLLLSPSARGLFNKAIMQSGTSLNSWASTDFTLKAAQKLGNVFDCDTKNLTSLANCLRGIDAYELAKYQYNVATPKLSEELNVNIFLPCVEPINSPSPFLIEAPRKILERGNFTDVPIIIGSVEMETIFLSKILEGGLLPDKLLNFIYLMLNRHPTLILNARFNNTSSPEVRNKIGKEMKQFYFQNSEISENTLVNLINATTDLYFLIGICDTVSYHLTYGISPIFQYHFTLESELGVIKNMVQGSIKGPSHGDDVGYLLYSQMAPSDIDRDGVAYKSMLKIIKMWTNFAKYGNPTPDPELNVEWKPVTPNEKFYLEIGEELILKRNVEEKRMDFWLKLRREENVYDI